MTVVTLSRLGAMLLAGLVLSACGSRQDEYFDACMNSPQSVGNKEQACKCLAEKSNAMTDDDYDLMKLRMSGNLAEVNAKMSSWTPQQVTDFEQRQVGLLECIDPSMMSPQ